MINIEAYLLNNDKRLLEITDTCYIKRVYTSNCIVFECVKELAIFTTKNINEVRDWYESI